MVELAGLIVYVEAKTKVFQVLRIHSCSIAPPPSSLLCLVDDGTGSLVLFKFGDVRAMATVYDRLCPGMLVLVRGNLARSPYEDETQVSIHDISNYAGWGD